ncbi:MAG: sugar phosphate isomerase/epimerase [Gemmataceae bacterium]
MSLHRRAFLGTALAATAGLAAEEKPLHVATNQYPWLTFYGRQKRSWDGDVEGSVKEVARAGLNGLEPLTGSVGQLRSLAPLLKKHDLEMRSLYVNSTLHDRAVAERSIQEVLAIGDEAKKHGCRILVTNPSPLGGGRRDGKTDAELEVQAANLDRLGAELTRRGQVLAYHNHDVELRYAAREFHHMMVATDPTKVSLCLDSHWIFRGAGDSQVALFDVVKLYGKRIVELHLRQSSKGVWTEEFGPGDIDHVRLVEMVVGLGVKPHLVLEQAVEGKTPATLDAVTAHQRGTAYVRKIFARMA